MLGKKRLLDGVSTRDLLVAFAISGAAVFAWIPTWFGGEDVRLPINLLAWFAISAATLGALASSLGLRFWPLGFVPPALWMATYTLIDAESLHGAPTPFYAGLVFAGLFAIGFATGVRSKGLSVVGLVSFVTLLLVSAPQVATLFGESLTPQGIRVALDLSPVTWVIESAGLDWMRHPSVYDLAGSLPPDVRSPFQGMLAGPTIFLVGWGLVLVAEKSFRSRGSDSAVAAVPGEPQGGPDARA